MFGESLFELKKTETRWASHENSTGAKGAGGKTRRGRKGSAWLTLENGEETVLACETGRSGMLRRIWMTIDTPNMEKLRGVLLEIYWDDAVTPAVRGPIGDFFCHGIGRMAVFKNALFSSPEGRSFNSFIPMPFKFGMKVMIKNYSGERVKYLYYDIDYTLGDVFTEDTLYFHSWFNRENPTRMGVDFELLPHLKGKGRFLGVNLGIRCNMEKYFKSWWGEGEVKVYLDGDKKYPTLCGTGVEDYVASAWGQGYYYDLYHGSQIYDGEKMEIACYRFHVPDPIYFHEDIRVTIQQIGGIDTNDELNKARFYFNQIAKGYKYWSVNGREIDFLSIDSDVVMPELFERQDDWSCCSYFYYDKPSNALPQTDVSKNFIRAEGV
jgi:hypothetical protein